MPSYLILISIAMNMYDVDRASYTIPSYYHPQQPLILTIIYMIYGLFVFLALLCFLAKQIHQLSILCALGKTA